MGLADLHIHTTHSWDGSSTVSAVLKYAAHETNLDVIAITDHDSITGALEALALAPRYGIQVVPGSEITSAEGHVLALFIKQRIPPKLSLRETVLRVGELGGLCVVPHPASRPAEGVGMKKVALALQDPDVARTLVGVETFNASLVSWIGNQIAEIRSRELPVAHVGSSDAHWFQMIGRGATRFPGSTPEALRQALEARTTQAVKYSHPNPVQILGTWFTKYILRQFGWVAWNASPQSPVELHRFARIPR